MKKKKLQGSYLPWYSLIPKRRKSFGALNKSNNFLWKCKIRASLKKLCFKERNKIYRKTLKICWDLYHLEIRKIRINAWQLDQNSQSLVERENHFKLKRREEYALVVVILKISAFREMAENELNVVDLTWYLCNFPLISDIWRD